MSSLVSLSNLQHFRDETANSSPTVVLYTKPWCSYCTRFKPLIEGAAISEQFKNVRFRTVDLEHCQDIGEDVKVSGVPSLDLYRSGKRIARQPGFIENDELEKWLDGALHAASYHNGIRANQAQYTGSVGVPVSPVSNVKLSTNQPMCQGKFEERRRRPRFLPKNKKAFSDMEPNCVFRPTEDDNGVLIGRANDETSYFDIILWNALEDDADKVYFSLDFMPDPVKKARFESAVFWVTFGQDSQDKEHPPLSIKDLFPVDAEDMVKRNFGNVERTRDGGSGEGDDSSSFVSSIDDENTRSASTSTIIRGHGMHSSTAAWNFSVEKGLAGRFGLDAHYDLYITLPRTTRVWMKLWGKAVLVSGEEFGLSMKRSTTLKIGTMEEPYERILDLSAVLQG